MSTLILRGVTVRYGGITALSAVDLTVGAGTVVGLIGPNGAGKTTLVNVTTGIAPLSGGSISLDGLALERLPAYRIARAGVLRTYQNIRLFGALSVRTNLLAGAYRTAARLDDAAARGLLGRVGINVPLEARASALPYGEQRRLELARALAARPATIMLDEPAAGMNPAETASLGRVIRSVAADGVGLLLVEHDMALVRAVCDHVVVLNFGEVIATGTPAEIARDPAVIEAYLGTEA